MASSCVTNFTSVEELARIMNKFGPDTGANIVLMVPTELLPAMDHLCDAVDDGYWYGAAGYVVRGNRVIVIPNRPTLTCIRMLQEGQCICSLPFPSTADESNAAREPVMKVELPSLTALPLRHQGEQLQFMPEPGFRPLPIANAVFHDASFTNLQVLHIHVVLTREMLEAINSLPK